MSSKAVEKERDPLNDIGVGADGSGPAVPITCSFSTISWGALNCDNLALQ
jgi:hypothetical protein